MLTKEIDDTFKNVQTECFSANHLIKEFDGYQECYPEEIWRLDIQRKYIRTFTGESIDNSKPKLDVQYLRDMMQGRKKYQRRQWVRDQEVYFGTKHQLTNIVGDKNRIIFRCYTPTGDDIVVKPDYTLKITPFCDMYLAASFGNDSNQRTIRAKAGVEYSIPCPLSTMDDTQVSIFCANRIQALGDLSACYIAANNFSMATKLKKLVLGNSTPGYNNARLTSLSLGNNTLLEELDITNCQNLSGAMDFNQYNNLTTFLAEGTSITSVVFAPSGKIKTAYLPDTVNTLEMQNLDKLTDFKASLDSLEKLTLRGGIISHKELLDKCIDTLKELYLYDINWTGVNSLPDTSLINQLLPSGALQNNLTNMFSSKITGFAYIDNEVHNRELVAYAKTWRDLEVRSASIIPQFSIKFVNYDGSLLNEQIIDRNEDAVEPIAAGNCSTPTKPSDGMYDYTFSGWDDTELTNITSNKTIQAQYSREAIQYTITFDTNGGTELASITQGYGTVISLPTITTKVGHTLIGWEPALPATMPVGGLHVVAQWQINQYTITFDTDGGNSIPAITQDYGTYVTRPADPTRKGYTFISWDKEIPATIPDQNITIKALWQINTYRVRYINGSTVLQTYEAVPYQTSVSYTGATPTWIGDGMGTFNGWSHDGTNIEQDTDIYAVYINVVLVPSSVKSLANCTWDEIKVMAKDGYLNSSRQWCYKRNGKEEVWFNIGDTKEVELTDGEKLVFQIWDFKHDPTVSSNGNETAAFTFGMAGLTKTTHSSGNLTTTWPESNIRTQVIPQYYDKLPKLLKSNITSVWKKAREKRSSKNILSYQERLFIPAVCEVRDGYGNAGAREWTDEHEGTKYPIFSDNASRAKGDKWFTRSVFSDRYSVEVFGYIKADGAQDWGSSSCKLCLCFCI